MLKKKDKELKKTENSVLTKPEYHWKEFKKKRTKILDLKSTTIKVKNSLKGFNSTFKQNEKLAKEKWKYGVGCL